MQEVKSFVQQVSESQLLEVFQLINMKTKGGLSYPSEDVIFVCQKTEKVFRQALKQGDGKLPKRFSEALLANEILKEFIFSDYLPLSHIIQIIKTRWKIIPCI